MMSLVPFISFEGLDLSGKSTQIQFLTQKLQKAGKKVLVIREPGGSVISEKIREILLDKTHSEMTDLCELLLYSAARHQLISEKIRPALQNNTFVIADRYVDSTTAYQGHGRQIDMSFVENLNKMVTDELLPTVTFYFDIDLITLQKRKSLRDAAADRLEEQNKAFYERIRKGYLKMAELNKTRIKIVNGTLPVDQIKKEIWEFVATKFSL